MSNKTKQKELFYLGYYDYKIDGIFGTRSKKATKEFQKEYGLKVDGIFGKNTTAKMHEVWKEIQIKLNYYNNSSLKIDGLVGNKTIEQIKKFQVNNKLKETGICDSITLNTLNKFDVKPMYPVNIIKITQLYKYKTHNGIDIGWDRNLERTNPSIIAPLDMKVVYNTTGSDAGNYLVAIANYNNSNDILFRFLHLKEKPSLKINDIVKKGDAFAIMGTTGRSTGIHLHFEVWIVPKNYRYSFSERYKYLKNPIDYMYIYPNQKVSGNNTYRLLTFK